MHLPYVWQKDPLMDDIFFPFCCRCDWRCFSKCWRGPFLFCWRRSGHESVWCCQFWHDQHVETWVSTSFLCCHTLCCRDGALMIFFYCGLKLSSRSVWVDLQSQRCHFHRGLLWKVHGKDLCLWRKGKQQTPPCFWQDALLASDPDSSECPI